MSDPFGDIPLFREIQRLLASSSGPINEEIARQIATAIATGEGDRHAPPDVARAFADAIHEASGIVAGYTRLPIVEPMQTRVETRASWATGTLGAWGWLLGRLGERFGGEFGRLAGEDEESAAMMQQAMGQVAPLLLGIQVGTVVGHLARETLTRYELPIPRDDDGKLLLVYPNVADVARDYSFDEPTFVRWLALHEAARGLVAAGVGWFLPYARGLLTEIVDSIEIDPGDIERRLTELQTQGMEALEQGFRPEVALPIAPTERHRRALERLHAFLALFEGYVGHVVAAVDEPTLGDTTVIDEGMSRRKLSPSDGKTMLASVLGLAIDRSVEAAGRTFCEAVVSLHGVTSLARVWDAPDNLPSLDELKDPFLWMERVLAEGE